MSNHLGSTGERDGHSHGWKTTVGFRTGRLARSRAVLWIGPPEPAVSLQDTRSATRQFWYPAVRRAHPLRT